MAIPFNQIPANLRLPLFKIEFQPGANGNQTLQQTVIVGQITTGTPLVMTYMSSAAVAAQSFGNDSMLAIQVRDYLESDPLGTVYVIGVADGGGSAKATGTIVFTGTATANGTLALYITGEYIPVGITSGMTAAQAATATVAAITAFVDPNGIGVPVTAAAATGTVTLTAVNAGLLGNDIDIRLNYAGLIGGQITPAGLTVAITAMASGSGSPTLTGVGAVIGNANADWVIWPWNDTTSLNAIQTIMSNANGRWQYQTQTYGHGWSAKKDADNTGATNLTFGATRDDPHCTVVSFEPGVPTWTPSVAAGYAGAFAVASRADPSRPPNYLSIPAVLPAPANQSYPPNVQNTLLSTGLALMQYVNGGSQILRAVTTYQFNPQGVPDQSYLDARTLYLLMAVVRDLQATVLTAYPRAKLAADGTNFGNQLSMDPNVDAPIATPSAVKSLLVARYEFLATQNAWVQDVADFENGLIVQINASDATRLDVLYDPVLVSGLEIFAVLTTFLLQPPANGTSATATAA
jgi:phage tail sheath gpL-like